MTVAALSIQEILCQQTTLDKSLLLTDLRMLILLRGVFHNRRARGLAIYSYASRAYFARRLGMSIRTVSRSVARLVKAGYIECRRRRRQPGGTWKSNLVLPTRLFFKAVGLKKPKGYTASHRGTRMTHKDSFVPKEKVENQKKCPPVDSLPGEGPIQRLLSQFKHARTPAKALATCHV